MAKPLGIPNAYPGKAEMLDEFEDHERIQAQMKQDAKTMAKALKKIGSGGVNQSMPE